MKSIKVATLVLFISGVIMMVTSDSFAYPPFLRVAKKFGATDCRFCHVNLEGGEPFSQRGNWLIAERKRRNAEVVDPEWLVDYKPSNTGKQGSGKKSPLEQELTKAEIEWTEAVKTRDRAKLERILSNDFMSTDESGKVGNKADFLQAAANLTIDSYNYHELSVRGYGTTAVVSALWDIKGSYEGAEFSGQFRETNVWLKKAGRWQVVATHLSRVPEKK